ncbi:hypothetical protein T4E_6120 [Trichinella pseudospiralis]|uniref:Secreted protein n=1 Tax=Trichinella pseudospiralis TaxID=6337 RepID=A0A0V0Y4H1_TRIPS|nr:hypothetical protein T4E_6120 [Trichinella pseudospiralis]
MLYLKIEKLLLLSFFFFICLHQSHFSSLFALVVVEKIVLKTSKTNCRELSLWKKIPAHVLTWPTINWYQRGGGKTSSSSRVPSLSSCDRSHVRTRHSLHWSVLLLVLSCCTNNSYRTHKQAQAQAHVHISQKGHGAKK